MKVERDSRQVDLGEVRLERCFDIRGRVVVPEGTPLSKVSVEALSGEDERASAWATAGARGEFVLACVPARETRVWASAGSAKGLAHVSPSTPQPIVLNLVEKGSLRLTVVDRKTGAPISGASLEALGPEDRAPPSPRRTGGYSNAQGEIALDDLASGKWELNVMTRCLRRSEPRFPSERRTVRVEPGKKTELTLPIACAE